MVRDALREEMLFGRIAYRLGFGRLEERFQWLPHPLVCYGILLFVVDVFVLQGFKELAGYRATFFTDPIWILQPILGLVTPVVVVYLHTRYRGVLEEIDVTARTSSPEEFDRLASQTLQLTFFVVLGAYVVWQFLFNVGIENITQIGGIAELIGATILLPLGYGIIFAEFLATYVGLLITFPRKIRRTDFELNYLDPEGLGGLRPAGEIMKTAYYFVVAGLLCYALMIYGPSIIGPLTDNAHPDPGLVQNVLFTSIWLLAIATMVYGLAQVHWFMKRRKREELTRLDREARSHVDDPFDMDSLEITDEAAFEDIRRRMEYVTNTQEYPTTFTMWVQLFVGLILPKAVQVVLSYL